MTKNLTATYVGTTELGYTENTPYNIEVFTGTLQGVATTFVRVVDNDTPEILACTNIISFLSNWTNIQNKA